MHSKYNIKAKYELSIQKLAEKNAWDRIRPKFTIRPTVAILDSVLIFKCLLNVQKWIQWPQISMKTGITIVSMTNGSEVMSWSYFPRWPPSAILDFGIERVSLDIFFPITLRNFYAEGDLCIMIWSQIGLNKPTNINALRILHVYNLYSILECTLYNNVVCCWGMAFPTRVWNIQNINETEGQLW